MVEKVETGGVKSFHYEKGKETKLDEKRKKEIEEGYKKYYARKERERRSKRIMIISLILIILILIILGIWLF